MKKFYFWSVIALAALSMTSCSQDETLEARPQENAIEFGTYLGRDIETRGTVLSDANLLNFGVFASYTNENDWSNIAPNFMYNQKVSRTDVGSDWTYSPKKYWPTNQGDKISFWSYAPYATADNGISITSSNTAASTPVITYTIDDTKLNQQADFTTDVEMNVTKDATTDPDGAARSIQFKLRHELTRVDITAQLDKEIDTNTKVNIKSIKFGGADLSTQATYTFGSVGDSRGTWVSNAIGVLNIDALLAKTTPTEFGTYSNAGVFIANDVPTALFASTKYLFLIPFANGVTTEEITMTIEYDIVTADASLNGEHSVTSATKIITIPAGYNLLKQGTAYKFNLIFYMNEIKLEASIDADWAESGYSDNVDWNDTDN